MLVAPNSILVRIIALGAILASLMAPNHLRANPPAGPTTTQNGPPKRTSADIIPLRESLSKELDQARARLSAAGETPSELLIREVDLLGRIDLLYSQQLAALEQESDSTATLADLQAQLETARISGLSETAPYSLLLLDVARDELNALVARRATIEAGVRAATEAVQQATQLYNEREAARRRANEASRTSGDSEQAPALAAAARFAQLESRVAAEQLELRRLELEPQRLAAQIAEVRIALLEERVALLSSDVEFSAEDLRSRLVEIETREDNLSQRLILQQGRASLSQEAWLDARRRLDESAGDDPALIQEVETRRVAYQVRQRELVILAKRIERLALMREMWNRRFQLWRGQPDRMVLADWDAETRAILDGLDTEHRIQELELGDVRKGLVALQNRIDALGTDQPLVLQRMREQVRYTTDLADLYESNAASIEGIRHLAEQFLTDLRGEMSHVSIGERLTDLWSRIRGVWQFELTSVDDHGITVGKLVTGLVLLIVGFWLSRMLSGWLARRVLPRFRLDEGAVGALRSIIFYLLMLSFVLLSLRVTHIPLTAFAILGGALAIGVGFGSQNIMNNFMSGLIILAERPIRVGDLIQIDALFGIVQHIGARSTRVLTGDNVEIIVPNSSFLEQNVVNWTLSETKVRVFVTVGVVYGSPLREVTRLLHRAVTEHGRILKTPEPIILFTEFGDNSLNFEIHFWIMMRTTMDRRLIESDIRFRIDSLFREADIVIAFPQRDVHLDAARPIDIRLVAPGATESPAVPERDPQS